jgi:N-acetyl-anhydromuramyl-L-alanine amidase AmpD
MFEYVKDANLQYSGAPFVKRSKTDLIILHHIAGEGPVELVNRVAHERIGYNLYVRLDGSVYRGRGIEYEGGHVKNTGKTAGMNARSIGIACEGNFEKRTMPAEQKNALFRVIRDCLKAYPDIKQIVGHKDVTATACPGKNFPLDEAKVLLHERDTKQKPAPQPKPVAFTLSRLLKKKLILMRGADVLAVQKALKAAGFNPGALDGIFGKQTQAAVIAFQKAKKLTPDGIVGKQTCTALGGRWTGK